MNRPTSPVRTVRVTGPLAPFAEGFRAALLEAGYTPLSAVVQLRLMAHASRWCEQYGLSPADLTEQRVEEFLLARQAAGYTGLRSRRALRPLLEFLTTAGAAPTEAPSAPPATRAQTLLASFERYLIAEKALAPPTVSAYVSRAGRFVADYTTDGDVAALTSADITRSVLNECHRVSVGAVQYFVAAVRAFLRFCHVQGLTEGDLSAAALAVTGHRRSLLPKGLAPEAAQALLESCDRQETIGRRDYAVLLMLLRLGVRAGEVAALRLEDIDWRAGQLVIHGKGSRDERLPLPVEVGEAIVAYLQHGRPATSSRAVFLTATAPRRRLTRETVSNITRRSCRRAGVPEIGAHRLRHTAACAMVRAAVPLDEIGQVLRHRDQTTTLNYARVDIESLRRLAQPWPQAGELR
jgi:site-specific recombinase XerD